MSFSPWLTAPFHFLVPDSPTTLFTTSALLYAALCGILLLVSVGLIYWLRDPEETDLASSLLATGAVWVGLAWAALPAVDALWVSATLDPTTGLKYPWATPDFLAQWQGGLRVAHGSFLGTVVVLALVAIPLVYFFYEENDLETSLGGRIGNAAKYTGFIVTIALVLFGTGLLIQNRSTGEDGDGKGGANNNGEFKLGWWQQLWSIPVLQRALLFVTGVLLTLGMGVYLGYTSLGLSLLPLSLTRVQPTPSAALRHNLHRLERDLEINRQMQRTITVRYENVRVPISSRDRKLSEELRRQETQLLDQLEACRPASPYCGWAGGGHGEGWCPSLATTLLYRPMQVLLGCAGIALSWTVVLSIALTNLDKIRHSVCGSDCGYYFESAILANPVALVLHWLGERGGGHHLMVPADAAGLLLLSGFLVLCTVVAIIYRGIGVLGLVQFYPIRPRATAPQALLFLGILTMFGVLAINFNLATHIAPHYLTYGSQVYCNATAGADAPFSAAATTQLMMGATSISPPLLADCANQPELIVPCDARAPPNLCTPTVLSAFLDQLSLQFPIFSNLFFHAQWVFLGLYILGFAVFLVKACHGTLALTDGRRGSNSHGSSSSGNGGCLSPQSGGGAGTSQHWRDHRQEDEELNAETDAIASARRRERQNNSRYGTTPTGLGHNRHSSAMSPSPRPNRFTPSTTNSPNERRPLLGP